MTEYWHGDEWRWRLTGHGYTTISVIEPADRRREPVHARRVPFGFGRVLAPESTAVDEPLLWEGDQA